MAGGVIIPYATKIFNQILKNKTIPDIFKTGILTPVLKKLKDATQMDNYRMFGFASPGVVRYCTPCRERLRGLHPVEHLA
jgi:hypothetical protein